MLAFTQNLNPLTGKNEWILQREDYDYKQEMARSSYADMLHDSERNEKYYEGIRRCVALLRSQNKEVHVLDIGAGTGLLSMMAASCGVDSVTACEAFCPIVNCARDIIKTNGFEDKIRVIDKRSTELECGPGKDIPRRANLLVTEVFDTELIGEGALETFKHAKENLLTPDALVVPSEGTMYAQVVSSELIQRWNRVSPILDQGKCLLNIPSAMQTCPGSASVHDLQLSEISPSQFTAISDPISVFEFDWSGQKIPLLNNEVTKNKFEALTSGEAHAVFMWWSLKMDPLGDVVLSCAPLWAHPLTANKENAVSEDLPWRDHWMQAIYYLPQPLSVQKSDSFILSASHDEYSLWFNVSHTSTSDTSCDVRPLCSCGLHLTAPRTRLGQFSDRRKTDLYVKSLQKYVKEDRVCLALGSNCLMGIVAAKLGARHVYFHETDSLSKGVLDDFINSNGVRDNVSIVASLEELPSDEHIGQINVVFSEPFYKTSLLPWHSLTFMYEMKTLSQWIGKPCTILPYKVTIRAMPVEFKHLWKIRAPLNTCCGFDLTLFDKLIESAGDEADETVEPQPLWEYPSNCLGPPHTLLTFNIVTDLQEDPFSSEVTLPLTSDGTLNGMAIWADWHFGPEEGDVLSTGPVAPAVAGEKVVWDMYTRQGIYLFKEKMVAVKTGAVAAKTLFNPKSGIFKFDFKYKIL